MSIISNKKAFHDYFVEEKFEAGISLLGWEVKAIRSGRANIKESYVVIRDGEVFIFGMHITPLAEASTHVHPDPIRTRKLLLHAKQISKLIGLVERAGYTLMPLDLLATTICSPHLNWMCSIARGLIGMPTTKN